jgi:hypothetical protein
MGRSKKTIPERVKLLVWGQSAGRCNMCNKAVYEDHQSLETLAHGEHAHIIAASDDGPRGDKLLSDEYAADPDNIILLCRMHHKKIDTAEYIDLYPPSRLREFKKQHEARVRMVTSIKDDMPPTFFYTVQI